MITCKKTVYVKSVCSQYHLDSDLLPILVTKTKKDPILNHSKKEN